MIAGKGIAIQGLSSNALHRLVVPLPPLAEQKRIVAKLEELLPLCERLRCFFELSCGNRYIVCSINSILFLF